MPRARRSTAPLKTMPLKGRAPASSFPFPDARTWPREICERLRNLKGDEGQWNDILLFDCGNEAAVYLEDALAVIQIIAADPADWHVEYGFPWLSFDPSLIDEYSALLSSHGYRVRIIDVIRKDYETTPKKPVLPPGQKVVDIAAARQALRNGGGN